MADEGGGGGRNDVIFIFVVLLFLIAVWFFTGGPKRAATTKNLFLSSPFGTGSSIGLPTVGVSGFGDSSSSDTGVTEDLTDTQSISLGLRSLPTSPYAGKVFLSNGGGVYGAGVVDEYVTLRSNPSNLQRISITGWRLQSAINKKTAYIYQGEEVYQPSYSSAGAIVLNPGDTATISSGRSPLGVSFKTNKCTGYLSQFQNFIPDLPQNCPLPLDEAGASTYGGSPITDRECLDYLRDMPQCHIAVQGLSSLPNACQSLVANTLTYNGCVLRHQSDVDFKGVEWRIYLGYSEKLWKDNREVLTLLDGDGKLVDSIVF